MKSRIRLSINKFIFSVIFVFAMALLFINTSHAVESICPGGSKPDSNVIFCDDFEGGDYNTKWDNGDGGNPIQSFGYSGKAWYSGDTGSDGSGCDGHYSMGNKVHWSEQELYVRYYTYKTPGFPTCSIATKGLIIDGTGAGNGYGGVYNCMWGTDAFLLHSYGLPSETLDQNIGTTMDFDGGKWYLIEAHIKLASPGQNNGVFELWIDDVSGGPPSSQTLRMRYTNLPLGNQGYTLTKLDLLTYQNSCKTGFSGKYIYYDQIVVSKSRIGAMGRAVQGKVPNAPVIMPFE
jgi:hypothetical protein